MSMPRAEPLSQNLSSLLLQPVEVHLASFVALL